MQKCRNADMRPEGENASYRLYIAGHMTGEGLEPDKRGSCPRALLPQGTIALLHYCPRALLHYCTIALLHYCLGGTGHASRLKPAVPP